MRVAFAGTPPFAAKALESLIQAGHEVVLVLTQPDRPSGRGMKLKASAVKECALAHSLPVLTPKSLSETKNPAEANTALTALENCKAQVLVVAAYGLILPPRALNACSGIGKQHDIRSINIHGSLLPRWRGAAPIQRAIEAGDMQTGITLMKMEKGLDSGPMIFKKTVPITDDETAGTLTEALTTLGAQAIVEALEHPDQLQTTPQPKEGVTYAHKLSRQESPIDWSKPCHTVARHIMAFNPFPSATARWHEETIKILIAKPIEGKGKPGEILSCKETVVIACGSGAIACERLQRPGKATMSAHAFIQSCQLQVGEVLS